MQAARCIRQSALSFIASKLGSHKGPRNTCSTDIAPTMAATVEQQKQSL
jgi:hypothetical protein